MSHSPDQVSSIFDLTGCDHRDLSRRAIALGDIARQAHPLKVFPVEFQTTFCDREYVILREIMDRSVAPGTR